MHPTCSHVPGSSSLHQFSVMKVIAWIKIVENKELYSHALVYRVNDFPTCTPCPVVTTPECTPPPTTPPETCTPCPVVTTPEYTSPPTTPPETTAVTVGVPDNKTDLDLTGTITTPTDDATDPAITTAYTKPDLHTSTGRATTDTTFIGMYKQTLDTVQAYPRLVCLIPLYW